MGKDLVGMVGWQAARLTAAKVLKGNDRAEGRMTKGVRVCE